MEAGAHEEERLGERQISDERETLQEELDEDPFTSTNHPLIMPTGNMPTGHMPTGNMLPTGNMPTGNMHTGNMFTGNMLTGGDANAPQQQAWPSVHALLKQVGDEFEHIQRDNTRLREELYALRKPSKQPVFYDPSSMGEHASGVTDASAEPMLHNKSGRVSLGQPQRRSERKSERRSVGRPGAGMRFTEFLASQSPPTAAPTPAPTTTGRVTAIEDGNANPALAGQIRISVPAPFNRPSVSALSFMGTGGVAQIAESIAASDVAALWPASVELRDEYQDGAVASSSSRKMNQEEFCGETTRSTTLMRRHSESDVRVAWFDFGVLHPDSRRMILMDTVGVFMVITELLLTPFLLAWDIAVEGGLRVMMTLSGLFWLTDFVLNFNKGFYRAGQLHMQRSAIVINYLHTWFAPDSALLIADAVALTLNNAGKDTPLLRITRACRMMKVLRITRLFRFVMRAMTLGLSWKVRFGLQMSSIGFITILLNHLLCCLWWVLGVHGPSDTGDRWPEAFVHDYESAGITWSYVTALHWTIAQMTLGSTDVMPVNSCERIFTVFMLLLALLFGSTLVSWISSLVVQVVMSRGDRTGKLNKLRQYLRQEHVPPYLAAQVQRQAIDRLGQQEWIEETSVMALHMLSRSLRLELIYATRMPLVMHHPLFRVWGQMDPRSVKVVCRECLSIKLLRPEDDLFLAGEVADNAYYLSEGKAIYVQRPSFAMVDEDVSSKVVAGAWLCEAALWCQWRHMGNMTATSFCKVLSINASALADVVRVKSAIETTTVTYAKRFHERVTLSIPPHAPWPTDLHVPFTETSDLLSKDVELNLLGLALSSGKLNLNENQRQMLQNELSQGKCCLQCDKQDNLVRIVALVALQIQRDNGDIFAQVGSWSEDSARASCQLPGTKRLRGELPHQAVRRLVFDDLPAFDNVLVFEGFEHSVEHAPSPKYGVDTTYLKAVQMAALDDNDDFPPLSLASCRTELIDPTASSVLDDIVGRDVYVLPDSKHKKLLYAWLHPDQFERLRKAENQSALNSWIGALRVVPDDIEEVAGILGEELCSVKI